MLNTEEKEEILEKEFLNKKYDIESCTEQIYIKYKIIFQIIIICFSLFIIIKGFSKKSKKSSPSNIENTEPLISDEIKIPVSKSSTSIPSDPFLSDEKKISTSIPSTSEPSESLISDEIKIPNPISSTVEASGPLVTDEKKISNPGIEPEPLVNIYLITHKDFKNKVLTNRAYKILCDEKTQLKSNYSIEIIETKTEDNILYPKKKGYSEGSKIYPIWKKYKEGNITSKYVGLIHYRRVFPFRNNIPDLDKIFKDHDVIIKRREDHKTMTTFRHYEVTHIGHFLNESLDIIREKFPEYSEDAEKFLRKKWANYCNIFIAKKEDFIKWGEFVFGILLELDKRYNLNTDDDIKKLIVKEAKKIKRKKFDIDSQCRLEAYLMERIGNIFYEHHWKKLYELPTVDL